MIVYSSFLKHCPVETSRCSHCCYSHVPPIPFSVSHQVCVCALYFLLHLQEPLERQTTAPSASYSNSTSMNDSHQCLDFGFVVGGERQWAPP